VDRGRSYLILGLTLAAGIALSIYIYLRYRVTVIIFFIPLIGIGGSLFTRVMRRGTRHGRDDEQGDIDRECRSHRIREPYDHEDENS
jgi:hypothetical protein